MPERLLLTILSSCVAALITLIEPAAARSTGGPANIAAIPISRMQVAWWQSRFSEKQREIQTQLVDLVWLGDSITQNWESDGPEPWRRFRPIWNRFYGDRHALDLGFRGDSTCHLLWRVEHGELAHMSPKLVILLIGANNFGRLHTDAHQTLEGVLAVLGQVHERLPAAQVLLLGVLPSVRSLWVDRNTALLNQQLDRLPAMMSWLHYMDLGQIFMSRGRVDPDRFYDRRLVPPDPPLHPTAQFQEEMAAAIEPLVASIMHDPIHR